MSTEIVLALIFATCVLVALPGPNVGLIIASTLRFGSLYGLVAVAGTTTGLAVQMILALNGLGVILTKWASLIIFIKLVGIIYLLFLGVTTWRQARPTPSAPTDKDLSKLPLGRSYRQGFIIAVTNPKTLLFQAAFLPQFVTTDGPALWLQLLLIGGIHLGLMAAGDSLWVVAANQAQSYSAWVGKHLRPLTAGFYFLAACLLGLANFSGLDRAPTI
ncbi:MAG: LysE family translocator [bacterium]